jgi:hypothetical protein
MAQHDYIISNQTFPNTRADLNNVLQAIATCNKGSSAPTTQYAGQMWIDDSAGTTWTLYLYDGSDNIQVATIDTTSNTINFIDSVVSGFDIVTDTTPQLGGDLDTNGNDINFGDNDKAQFGASQDLQIYHDGSGSYIDDTGTGSLVIRSNEIQLQKYTGETIASFIADGTVQLRYDNVAKLATTSTGIDVTGNVVSDGLTVDTTADNGATISAHDNSTTTYPLKVQNNAGSGRLEIGTYGINNNLDLKFQTLDTLRMRIDDSLGDVDFYEDTGTTTKMRWDASTERLGIGTSSPATALDVQGGNITQGATGSNAGRLLIDNTTDTIQRIKVNRGGSSGQLAFHTGADTERMRIDSSGNVIFKNGALLEEGTLTDGATIAWDVNASPVAKVTLGGNRTISAPSNSAGAGQFISLLVIQDGTGSRTLTWNAVYEFASDTAPTLTTTGGKGDLFVFRYNGTKWLEVGRNLNLTLS